MFYSSLELIEGLSWQLFSKTIRQHHLDIEYVKNESNKLNF